MIAEDRSFTGASGQPAVEVLRLLPRPERGPQDRVKRPRREVDTEVGRYRFGGGVGLLRNLQTLVELGVDKTRQSSFPLR